MSCGLSLEQFLDIADETFRPIHLLRNANSRDYILLLGYSEPSESFYLMPIVDQFTFVALVLEAEGR